MPETNALASQFTVKIDSTEVQQDVMTKVVSIIVDQHTHLPGMFKLTFFDSDLALLDDGPFDLTKTVEIEAENADGESKILITGDITALETDFGEGMIAQLIVQGYDKTHRLFRETKSQAFLNKKDSDLASDIARAVDLQTEIDPTSTVYDHIFQHNQTDLGFLMQRAWRIGYECFVSEDKLFFRKPPTGNANLTLTWGDDLKTFRPRMTLAEQVDEVVVRGWDVQKKEPIVGRASSGNLYPSVGEQKDGKTWASEFGTGKKVIVDQSVVSQAEADVLATARLDEISGSFIEAQGEAYRRPEITAGQMVSLEGLGNRFSGNYLVTNATHIYSPEGLRTHFSVRGTRTGLITEQINGHPGTERFPGVVTAIVTNTDDPENWGRVKVKFPWMTDDAESAWARVLGLGAGDERGFFILPEVDDEVLVTFAHGDFSQPYIIGGVWNGQHAVPPEGGAAPQGEKPQVRIWRSANGNLIAMYDNADKKIDIHTAEGHQFSLDDANKKISLTTNGGLSLTMDDNGSSIKIQSSSEVEIKSDGNLKIEAGGNLDLKATGQVNVQGATINLN